MPDAEHKKAIFSYVDPILQTADDIDKTQEIIGTDFIDLQTKYDQVNDVATDQLKQKKIEDIIDADTNKDNPLIALMTFGGKNDSKETVEASKNILDEVNAISDNILKNLRPVHNRTTQELIDDDFIPIDDRTQQELEDGDYVELESDVEEEPTVVEPVQPVVEPNVVQPNVIQPGADRTEPDIDLTSDWDPKKQNYTYNKTFNRLW